MSIEHLIHYLNTNEPKIHKWYSIKGGWCYLSDKNGNRVKVTGSTQLQQLKSIIEVIKNAKYIYHSNK